MQKRKAKGRQTQKRPRPPARRLGTEAAILGGAGLLTWSYTGWALYSSLRLHRHVHIPGGLIVSDIFFASLSIILFIAWLKTPSP